MSPRLPSVGKTSGRYPHLLAKELFFTETLQNWRGRDQDETRTRTGGKKGGSKDRRIPVEPGLRPKREKTKQNAEPESELNPDLKLSSSFEFGFRSDPAPGNI